MKFYKTTIYIIIFIFTFSVLPAYASSSQQASGPTYIVSSGDSLLEIAARFNVNYQDIMTENNIVDPNQIYPGDYLVIPGLEGLSGVLYSQIVPFGESQNSISRQYRIAEDQLRKLNHLVSPTEFYAGANLILLENNEKPAWTARSTIEPGMSMLELSIINDLNPWTITEVNGLSGSWATISGDILFHPGTETESNQSGLPFIFLEAVIDPLPVNQGATVQIQVQTISDVSIGGSLIDRPLYFHTDDSGQSIALQGIHALVEPGLYPIRLDGSLPNGETYSYEQMILVESSYYPSEVLQVDPESIDPAITVPEEDLIKGITSISNPEKYWGGAFISPAIDYEATSYLTSKYGTRRKYMGIGTDLEIDGFHSGLDFGGGTGLPITAPARGKVVFAGELEVRGFATIIDHGWGIYSGFWHQSEILVEVGEMVEPGQTIGIVGGTGRVTGPHLHWEVWVNGVQVDPMSWLENTYPN